MALDSTHILSSLTLGFTLILLTRWYRRVRDLPPGPMKLPLLGNLFNIPTEFDSDVLAQMGEKFGSEILHFEALGNSIVVLNSRRVAEELLDKRSGIYSSRPQLPMINLSGWDFQFVLMPYTSTWRLSRKLFTHFFNSSSSSSYQHRIELHIHKFLKHLLDTPQDYFTHIRNLPGAITLDLTYGLKPSSYPDPYITLAEQGVTDAAELFATPNIVDALPILRYLPPWFPGAAFHKRAARSRELARRTREEPWGAALEGMKMGRYERSLVSATLEDTDTEADRYMDAKNVEDILKGVAGTVYFAASDTTMSTLGTLFLALVTHPEVQKKAQEALDRVLQGSLPTYSDLGSLPYLSAVVLEVYRWKPAIPTGVPHSLTEDDVFERYYIPAGSSVIPNQRAMLHDPTTYPNPHTFNPSRFLLDNGSLDPEVKSPMDIAFGFGRRICPGRHTAHSIILLTAASVLSLFDIEKEVDGMGRVREPTGEYSGSVIVKPKEFPCRITPRSKEAREVVLGLGEE